MQIWAESGKSALPICNYSQILYQFLTFTQNLKRSHGYTGTNSRSYVYTTPNPPSNPYCEAILTATDEKGDEYAVWKGTLRDAK